MTAPVIHWFRRDLRLADNPALTAAVHSGRPVIPVYVLDNETAAPWSPGGASRWWLHHSLAALQASLRACGGTLVLRRGRAEDVLLDLIAETGAEMLTFSRAYGPGEAAEEQSIADTLYGARVDVYRFPGSLLHEPEAIKTRDGGAYQVFTPFYRACLDAGGPDGPLPAPNRIDAPETIPGSDRLADWGLLPRAPDWSGGLRAAWTPGEAGALARLEAFLDQDLARYGHRRDRPDRPATSRLSPHLRFGEVSPRTLWTRVALAGETEDSRAAAGASAFLRELVWREFSHHLLHHWPALPDAAFRPSLDPFPWRDDPDALAAWQQGRTGYPLVDAGMRELWRTGWMHNRVRMVAASFLVKHLLIAWQRGEAWFWDTLVDADLANNAAGWQWVAGSGADAAPYFRIFNPMTQGRKFDPEGAYTRRFVPELKALPTAYIHAPWEAPAPVLRDAGVRLGETYPKPIVDHAAARERALAAYDRVKGSAA